MILNTAGIGFEMVKQLEAFERKDGLLVGKFDVPDVGEIEFSFPADVGEMARLQAALIYPELKRIGVYVPPLPIFVADLVTLGLYRPDGDGRDIPVDGGDGPVFEWIGPGEVEIETA